MNEPDTTIAALDLRRVDQTDIRVIMPGKTVKHEPVDPADVTASLIITGTLGPCLYGKVIGDTRGRFCDYEGMETSPVAHFIVDGCDPDVDTIYAKTKNSLYRLYMRSHNVRAEGSAPGNDRVVSLPAPITSNIGAFNALNVLARHFHDASVAAGWYDDPVTGQRIDRNVPEMLALLHSEVSEMLEGHRKNKMDDHLPHRRSIEVEAADVLIRLFDLAGYLKLDLAGAVMEKAAYNLVREDHKREARAKADGKRF